jgi:hypothetical protein
MLYHLINKAGAHKFCRYEEAKSLCALGEWQDVTKYKEKDYELKPILLHEEHKREEPRQQHDKRSGDWVQHSSNPKVDGNRIVSEGQNVIQERQDVKKPDVPVSVVKKRGRPRKIKGTNNASKT